MKMLLIKQSWPIKNKNNSGLILLVLTRMLNIDASLGYAQMLRIDNIINRKRHILNYYKSKLLKYEDISMNFDKKTIHQAHGCQQ